MCVAGEEGEGVVSVDGVVGRGGGDIRKWV